MALITGERHQSLASPSNTSTMAKYNHVGWEMQAQSAVHAIERRQQHLMVRLKLSTNLGIDSCGYRLGIEPFDHQQSID